MEEEFFRNYIVDLIRSAVIRGVRREYPLDKNTVAVTEVIGCLRQSFYNRVFLYELDYPSAFRILRGILMHEWLAERLPVGLTETGEREELRLELDLGDGGKLVGRADYVVGDYVIELKTTSRRKLDAPREEHVKQVLLYMYMLGKERGFIVYLHDSGDISAFPVKMDRELVKKLLNKAKALRKALKEGVPPPPEPGSYCKWCQWRSPEKCREGYEYASTSR